MCKMNAGFCICKASHGDLSCRTLADPDTSKKGALQIIKERRLNLRFQMLFGEV